MNPDTRNNCKYPTPRKNRGIFLCPFDWLCIICPSYHSGLEIEFIFEEM